MSYIVPQKMPLRCFECPCCHTIGYFECVSMHKDLRSEHGINISRPDWCPLIEVPPHSRLVDLDQIIDEYWDGYYMRIGARDLEAISSKAIIEAEEE